MMVRTQDMKQKSDVSQKEYTEKGQELGMGI